MVFANLLKLSKLIVAEKNEQNGEVTKKLSDKL